VRLRLEPGRCYVVGRRADVGLYDYELATYDAADTFRHEDAAGFVRLWGLSSVVWSARQGYGRDPGRDTGRPGPVR
jgi:argininosuccinate synthase